MSVFIVLSIFLAILGEAQGEVRDDEAEEKKIKEEKAAARARKEINAEDLEQTKIEMLMNSPCSMHEVMGQMWAEMRARYTWLSEAHILMGPPTPPLGTPSLC